MRASFWLVVVALVVLLGGGGTVAVVSYLSERERVRDALRRWAVAGNLDPDAVEAIGKVESGWRLNAVNRSGADGARGGSWGPTQISERTARAHGYTGPMEAFTQNADLAAQWTARILNAGRPRNAAEYVAVWNAGRYRADTNLDGDLSDEARVPSSTRADYWPAFLDALAYVQANPLSEAA